MIKIYTTPTCASCRKAKKWLDEHQIKYQEVNLIKHKLTEKELNEILKNTENGVEDIISKRSKLYNSIDMDSMTIGELKNYIINNPLVLRRPIMVGDDRMQIGYNEEDIDVFMSKKLRGLLMSASCDSDVDCDYKKILADYLDEIRRQIKEEKKA